MVWSNIHLGTAIICACLLTLRPLMIKWLLSLSTLRHRYGLLSNSKSWSFRFSRTKRTRDANSTHRFHSAQNGDQIDLVEAVGGAKAEDGHSHNEHPPNSIIVQNSIKIV